MSMGALVVLRSNDSEYPFSPEVSFPVPEVYAKRMGCKAVPHAQNCSLPSMKTNHITPVAHLFEDDFSVVGEFRGKCRDFKGMIPPALSFPAGTCSWSKFSVSGVKYTSMTSVVLDMVMMPADNEDTMAGVWHTVLTLRRGCHLVC